MFIVSTIDRARKTLLPIEFRPLELHMSSMIEQRIQAMENAGSQEQTLQMFKGAASLEGLDLSAIKPKDDNLTRVRKLILAAEQSTTASLDTLQYAYNTGRENKLDEKELHPLGQRLIRLRHEPALNEALRSQDVQQVQAALDAAVKAGFAGPLVEQVRQHLKLTQSSKSIIDILLSEDPAQIEAAVAQGAASGFPKAAFEVLLLRADELRNPDKPAVWHSFPEIEEEDPNEGKDDDDDDDELPSSSSSASPSTPSTPERKSIAPKVSVDNSPGRGSVTVAGSNAASPRMSMAPGKNPMSTPPPLNKQLSVSKMSVAVGSGGHGASPAAAGRQSVIVSGVSSTPVVPTAAQRALATQAFTHLAPVKAFVAPEVPLNLQLLAENDPRSLPVEALKDEVLDMMDALDHRLFNFECRNMNLPPTNWEGRATVQAAKDRHARLKMKDKAALPPPLLPVVRVCSVH